ncbi:hypothetical protein [Nocardioides ungokensis]|jgi:hypothetical protein|uniref:hypothetical protein n=1 Tax=Nocardioides ungokensis TaxID=1643322 RepID=UPI0015DF322E|nr:hypothetical protein [Nocardioides ungokensis]
MIMEPLTRRPRLRGVRHRVLQAAGVTLVAAGVVAALLPGGFDVADMNLPGSGSSTVGSSLQTPTDAHLAALMQRYRCSTDGFGHSQIPGSAIIRRADGTVAVVSFDRGWQIFKADGPASLVAVCLRPHD